MRWSLPVAFATALVVAVSLLTAPPVAAQDEPDPEPERAEGAQGGSTASDPIVVIQPAPFLRGGRVELEPTFHAMFNDPLVQQLGAGLNINFHINEWIFVGASGIWEDWRFISTDNNGFTDARERVIDATDAIPDASVLNAYAGGEVGFVPLYGKFALFNNAIIHWDLSVAVGGGVVHSRANEFLGAGTLSIGQRFFLTDWLSFNTEVRALFYAEDLGNGSSFYQQWLGGIGLAFWIPPSFEYSD